MHTTPNHETPSTNARFAVMLRRLPSTITGAVVVAVFAAIGTILLTSSHAATPTTSIQPEAGTTTGAVTKLSDSTASGNGAVRFSSGGTGFVHPGVLVSRSQLDFVKGKIDAGTQPWKGAYDAMMNGGRADDGQIYSSLSYTPHPIDYVQCGSGSSSVAYTAQGCSEITGDSIAAYTDALIWYISGNPAYAQKAIQIMNAWSAQLVDIRFNTTQYTNGILEAAWSGETITRAAELIRYTYSPTGGETALNVPAFEAMLTKAYLPHVSNGWIGGGANWLMSMADATMDIGIFTNDRTTYNNGLSTWRRQIKSIIYMGSDTNPYSQLQGYPIPPANTQYDKATTTKTAMDTYWHNPGQYEDGLEGETCRDAGHMLMGLEAAVNGAETAGIQGDDLFTAEKSRIVAAYEFSAQYVMEAYNTRNTTTDTGTVPSWLCGGTLKAPENAMQLGWEVAYNAYAGRQGVSMPYTKAIIDKIRPTKAGLHMDWETLTFAAGP